MAKMINQCKYTQDLIRAIAEERALPLDVNFLDEYEQSILEIRASPENLERLARERKPIVHKHPGIDYFQRIWDSFLEEVVESPVGKVFDILRRDYSDVPDERELMEKAFSPVYVKLSDEDGAVFRETRQVVQEAGAKQVRADKYLGKQNGR